jgi:hypothetical protein
MVTFAFLGNTLFLTILVAMLSSTFAKIVNDVPAEIQFRRAVATLEGVKGDAIFAYPVPFNILAFVFLVPLRFFASPRWFHKIHVLSVRLVNLPLLLIIAIAERRSLWPRNSKGLSPAPTLVQATVKPRRRFWERFRITAHRDIYTVFEVPPPDSVLNEITTDDDLTRHLIRRQFTPKVAHSEAAAQPQPPHPPHPSQEHLVPEPAAQQGQVAQGHRPSGRRDSIAPFPGLRAELQGVLSESDEMTDITSRLETLEESMQRIESMLEKLVAGGSSASSDGGSVAVEGVEPSKRRLTLIELNREAEEE